MMIHVGLINLIAGLFIVSLSSVGLGCCIASLFMLRKPKKKHKTSDYRKGEPDTISHREARRRTREGGRHGEIR